MDCRVHGVTKSQTWLSSFHFTSLHPFLHICTKALDVFASLSFVVIYDCCLIYFFEYSELEYFSIWLSHSFFTLSLPFSILSTFSQELAEMGREIFPFYSSLKHSVYVYVTFTLLCILYCLEKFWGWYLIVRLIQIKKKNSKREKRFCSQLRQKHYPSLIWKWKWKC